MKTAIIYWSGTGNTRAMAEAIGEGAGVKPSEVSAFSSNIADYDAIALGCPSMGAEELEETEFAPFFDSIEDKLSGKTLLLFGSYGWGDGEWMRSWEERCRTAGAVLVDDKGYIVNEAPADDQLDVCRELGKALSSINS